LKHKHTRHGVDKEEVFSKKAQKSCKKLLTKEKRSDNICKHSARGTRERLRNNSREAKKKALKKTEKSLKKGLTKRDIYDILVELSRKEQRIGP
jgi:hypothetical protein